MAGLAEQTLLPARNALVLSDIHLGASTGLLTVYDDDGQGGFIERPNAKRLLENLLTLTRETIGPDNTIEQCILLGDIFDFSFASYGLAMKNGYWFFHELAKSGLFERFVFIPGNHDHHLWQQLIEQQFVLNNLYQPAINHPKTLPMNECLSKTFMDGLLPEPYGFDITYPNYGLQIGGRPIFFHHGHFLQPLYSAASKLLSEVLETRDIEDLEAFNAPFLELGWYNLGQAYNVGEYKLVDRLYFLIKNQQAESKNQAVEQVLRLIISKLEQWDNQIRTHRLQERVKRGILYPFKWVYHQLLQWLGPHFVKHFVLSRVRLFEQRRHASTARHETVRATFRRTIAEYLNRYCLPEAKVTGDCAFVFGHTHEPANDVVCRLSLKTVKGEKQRQVAYLYNTGGWVVDQLKDGEGTVQLTMPKMNPLYIDDKGQVHTIPFLQTQYELIESILETDSAFVNLKNQLVESTWAT